MHPYELCRELKLKLFMPCYLFKLSHKTIFKMCLVVLYLYWQFGATSCGFCVATRRMRLVKRTVLANIVFSVDKFAKKIWVCVSNSPSAQTAVGEGRHSLITLFRWQHSVWITVLKLMLSLSTSHEWILFLKVVGNIQIISFCSSNLSLTKHLSLFNPI